MLEVLVGDITESLYIPLNKSDYYLKYIGEDDDLGKVYLLMWKVIDSPSGQKIFISFIFRCKDKDQLFESKKKVIGNDLSVVSFGTLTYRTLGKITLYGELRDIIESICPSIDNLISQGSMLIGL